MDEARGPGSAGPRTRELQSDRKPQSDKDCDDTLRPGALAALGAPGWAGPWTAPLRVAGSSGTRKRPRKEWPGLSESIRSPPWSRETEALQAAGLPPSRSLLPPGLCGWHPAGGPPCTPPRPRPRPSPSPGAASPRTAAAAAAGPAR